MPEGDDVNKIIYLENDVNEIIYVENGTESVDVPCGKVPEKATAIEWFIKKSNQWSRIMKVYHTESRESQNPYIGHNGDKYEISESLNTYLLVKDINFSDNSLFKCSATGRSLYSHITLLNVVGKLLYGGVFISSSQIIS